MGVPLNLQDIQSGFLSASAHTANNTLIEEALDKALDRTGTTNNAMETNLDMGLNRLINLGAATSAGDAISLGQVNNIVSASSDNITSTADVDNFTATDGQTVFNTNNADFLAGTNALLVFINGVYQTAGTDYTETANNQITFTTPLEAGDVVAIIGAKFDAESLFNVTQTATDNAEGFAEQAQNAVGYSLGVKNVTTASYTLSGEDGGSLVRMTNASANTITVPTKSSVPFTVGTIVSIRQVGDGITTVEGAAGVTINASENDFSTAKKDTGAALVKVADDEWDFVKSYVGITQADLDEVVTNLEAQTGTVEGSVTTLESQVNTNTSNISTLRDDVDDNANSIANIGNKVELSDFPSNITPSVNTSGWQELPTGLILQWGYIATSSSTFDVTFPKTFTQACINVSLTQGSSGGDNNLSVDQLSTTGFRAVTREKNAYWFAIGI